ncbi:unnamed protein product, partial [Polarella glacialis]
AAALRQGFPPLARKPTVETRVKLRGGDLPLARSVVKASAASPVPLVQEEPAECAAHRYAEPAHVGPALRALAKAQLSPAEKRARAGHVLRGCLASPCPEIRELAWGLAVELPEARGAGVDGLLYGAAADAEEAQLKFDDVSRALIGRMPVPMEALMAGFAGTSRTMLEKIRPMDVIK